MKKKKKQKGKRDSHKLQRLNSSNKFQKNDKTSKRVDSADNNETNNFKINLTSNNYHKENHRNYKEMDKGQRLTTDDKTNKTIK